MRVAESGGGYEEALPGKGESNEDHAYHIEGRVDPLEVDNVIYPNNGPLRWQEERSQTTEKRGRAGVVCGVTLAETMKITL